MVGVKIVDNTYNGNTWSNFINKVWENLYLYIPYDWGIIRTGLICLFLALNDALIAQNIYIEIHSVFSCETLPSIPVVSEIIKYQGLALTLFQNFKMLLKETLATGKVGTANYDQM